MDAVESEFGDALLRHEGRFAVVVAAGGRIEAWLGAVPDVLGRARAASDTSEVAADSIDALLVLTDGGARARLRHADPNAAGANSWPVQRVPLEDGPGGARSLWVLGKVRARAMRATNLHDEIGLPGRRILLDRVERALGRGEHVGLICLDIDGFKRINDSFGVRAGDEALRCLAERLGGLTSAQCSVAHLGGDEFGLLLEGRPSDGAPRPPVSRARLADAVERLLVEARRRVGLPLTVAGKTVRLSSSAGVVLTGDEVTTGELLFRDADIALHAARRRGSGQVVHADRALAAQASEHVALEVTLHEAINRGELRLHVQPQFRLRDGELVGAEALVRWQHPERGLLSPGAFLPAAEASGSIVDLDRWVLGRAIELIGPGGVLAERVPTLSVNVSVRTMMAGHAHALIHAALAAGHVRAEQLEVEVTETVFIDAPAQAREEMERLRALGIKLALDDFGTGYASLAYLRDFRFDRLKLDQGFVRSIAVDDHLRAISGAVVQLAGALGCEVVAEGVEDDDQARILAALGCAVGQGFGLARPGVPEFYFGR